MFSVFVLRHPIKKQIKTAIPHVDARFRTHPLQKQIGDIASKSKSSPAILHVDARFRAHPLQKQISDIASKSQSKPAIPHVDARFRTHPLQQQIGDIASNSKLKLAVRLYTLDSASTQSYNPESTRSRVTI